jgi:hypothetical protein
MRALRSECLPDVLFSRFRTKGTFSPRDALPALGAMVFIIKNPEQETNVLVLKSYHLCSIGRNQLHITSETCAIGRNIYLLNDLD